MLRALVDGTIFAEAYGPGPVRVVWLHGWARRSTDFAVAATALAAEGVSSMAIDLPGFGVSPPPPVVGGARSYVPTVASAVREVADGPVVLVGHSFGGRVALCLAAREPALVASLVLTGVPQLLATTPAPPRLAYRLIRAAARRHLVGERTLEAARQRYGSADYRNAHGTMRDVLVATVAEHYEDELAAWRGPTALLWGRDDTAAPLAMARAAAARLAHAPEVEVVDVGHLVPTLAPDALADVVRRCVT